MVNFRYREGSLEEHEGDVFFQTSDFGMARGEFWFGGPLSDQITYSVAGHYTTDEGIRDVGFDANAGTNLYGNLKYHFADDSGHFKVSGRQFKESAVVYLGTPLLGSAENPQQIPGGPDVTTGSLLGPEIVQSQTYCAVRETCSLDLENGNDSEMSYFGTELVKGWQWGDVDLEFISRNRYTDDESGFFRLLLRRVLSQRRYPKRQWNRFEHVVRCSLGPRRPRTRRWRLRLCLAGRSFSRILYPDQPGGIGARCRHD